MSETLSLLGRASAGAYYVQSDTDVRLRVDGFELPTDDSDSTWGGRFGGAVGVKIPLYYAGASLTLLGTIDYMTDVATIDHTRPLTGELTRAGFDDAIDVGARVGLVFPLR